MPDQRWIDKAERVLPCWCDDFGHDNATEHHGYCPASCRLAVAQLAQEAFEAGQQSANQVGYQQNVGPVTRL